MSAQDGSDSNQARSQEGKVDDKVNYLTRWKIQLDSRDKKMYKVALLEIVAMLNNLNEEQKDGVYSLIIKSDICHFLSEKMSYGDRNATMLTNKIICHLSEVETFFKSDFVRILRGYLRVIKSLLENADEKYHRDIFTCVSIFMKRARERDFDFKSETFPFNYLVATIGSFNKIHLMQVPALDLINFTFELMIDSPTANESDTNFRSEKISEVLKQLNVQKQHLESVMFMLLTSKILHNILFYIPSKSDEIKPVHQLMRVTLIDKFLAIVDYILLAKTDHRHYEIFCNMIYYLLTSVKLELREKLQILNRLFMLNGLHSIISMIIEDEEGKSGVIQFKSKVLLSEVLVVFLTFMKKSAEVDPLLKKACYQIVFKCNMKLMGTNDASRESMLLYIFVKFIDFVWKTPTFDAINVLSNTALILAITKLKKIKIDPSFFKMLTTIYMAAFTNVSIEGNELLQTSSKAILVSIRQVTRIDLKYLIWWKAMGKPKAKNFRSVVTNFLQQNELNELDNLQPQELALFDKSLLMNIFFNPTTSIKAHSNVKRILCQFVSSCSSKDYEKLLKEFTSIQWSPSPEKIEYREQMILNILGLMMAYSVNVANLKLKVETCTRLLKAFIEPTTSFHVKEAVTQILVNFVKQKDLADDDDLTLQ